FVLKTLEQYPLLCASRLYAMVKERGYTGGPDHFRHLIAEHRPRKIPEAFQRLKTLQGEQAQQARHATSQHSGTPVTNIHSPTQRMG
ncbi:hypothetical protein BMR09_09995, partial [Methylococcaceae bacterium CS3]